MIGLATFRILTPTIVTTTSNTMEWDITGTAGIKNCYGVWNPLNPNPGSNQTKSNLSTSFRNPNPGSENRPNQTSKLLSGIPTSYLTLPPPYLTLISGIPTRAVTTNPVSLTNLSTLHFRNPNPGSDNRPWCYTTYFFKRWAYCDVPKCEFSSTDYFVRKHGPKGLNSN
eukprot:sb/3472326/